MIINKITKDTKPFKTDYVSFWITETDYIIKAGYITEDFPINTPIKKLNNFIFERLDEDYYVEDNGDYWEFNEEEDERTITEKLDKQMERDNEYVWWREEIQDALFNIFTEKQPSNAGGVTLSLEFLEEENKDILNAAIALSLNNEVKKYFPLSNYYDTIVDVLNGEVNIFDALMDDIYDYIEKNLL